MKTADTAQGERLFLRRLLRLRGAGRTGQISRFAALLFHRRPGRPKFPKKGSAGGPSRPSGSPAQPSRQGATSVESRCGRKEIRFTSGLYQRLFAPCDVLLQNSL